MDTTQTVPDSSSQAVRFLRQKIRDGSLRDFLRDWKWIFSFTRSRWLQIAGYTLLGILSSALALLTAIVSKYLIDCIIAVNREQLIPLAILMIFSGGLTLGVQSLSARLSARLGVAMHCDVQAHVFDQFLKSQWLSLGQFSTGDLMARFSGDVSTVAGCAVSWLPNVIIQFFTLIATLCVVLWYDPVMALIALSSTPVLIFSSRRLLRRQREFQLRQRQVSSGMSAFEAETFRNLDTLKSFGAEDDTRKKLDTWQENYRKVVLQHSDFSVKTHLLLTAMGTAVQYLALGYCLWQLWSGRLLVGTMVLFLQQRSHLSNAFSSLVSLIPTALNGSVAAQRLRDLTELPKEDLCAGDLTPPGPCSLDIHNVCVAYEDGRAVLKNATIQVPGGHIAALVGPSGEGKSTLLRLILGLLIPDNGAVWLTDQNGIQHPLGADTRRLFAYVPQGNTLLRGTVEENLRIANHRATREEMVQALKDACAWEFLESQGLDTPIGEGGKGFSEGQAQRIAIARALVRKAPVLLLDEVTSALDPETEKQVLGNLLRRGLTCIAATHRTSLLPLCHRVYRIRDGNVTLLEDAQIRELCRNAPQSPIDS